MTATELRKAEVAYQAASRRYKQATDARNAAIAKAVADGWTHAKIADATGLTRARVGQIAHRTKEGTYDLPDEQREEVERITGMTQRPHFPPR